MSKRRRRHGKNNSLIRDEHGAVTIYSILIIVPIFIFQAVLIDFVRIKVATMEAEQALRAATRSVLSAYDKKLIAYGLFGLEAKEIEQKSIANAILTKYGTDGVHANTFQWIVLHVQEEQTKIVPVYSLGDHRLFHQQILEDMKYKAPIEFSRNLYNKWKGKKEVVVQAEEELHVAEDIDALLNKREQKLLAAFSYVKLIYDRANALSGLYNEKLREGFSQEDAMNLLSLANNDFLFFQNKFQTMCEYVQDADEIERSIKALWNEDSNTLLNDTYILGNEFYSNYILGASVPISAFGAFINQLSSVQEGDLASGYILDFNNSFQSWFDSRQNEESRRTNAFADLDNKKKEQKKKINDQMDQTKRAVLNQICSNDRGEQYDQLETYYQEYLNINNALKQQEYDTGASLEQKPDRYQSNAISFLSNLTSVMETIRDEAYVNEYAMYYFNHRTSTNQLNKSPLQDQLIGHTLQEQEVEYILYGLPSCTANRMAAYTEIYMTRFAIRMIESLTDARKAAVGSPLLIVLIAAAEGGIKAYKDMEQITKGEDVPVFSKFGAITMGYSDYLRMFLSVHSREDRKLSRIQALIQLNSQIDLQQRPAYIEVRSKMTVKLWFIRGREYQIKKTAAMSY